jgi:hypothetical protein
MQFLLVLFLLIVFPICGFQALAEGEIGIGVFFLSPLTIVLCVYAYQLFYDEPRKKRQEALHKMFNLPQYIRNEYGEVWDRELQKVIMRAINETTDSAKLNDLKHCQRVAKTMNKDSTSYKLDRPFYKINNAFRLTGCHFTITDSQGKTITKIV